MSLKRLNVVAGLIFKEKRLLVCQRGEGGDFPLKWEFPGGKVEDGESFETALRRELKEELDIEVERATEKYSCHHTYPGICRVWLKFYQVHGFEGVIKNLVFHDLAWVEVNELARLDFLAADLPLVDELSRSGERFFAP